MSKRRSRRSPAIRSGRLFLWVVVLAALSPLVGRGEDKLDLRLRIVWGGEQRNVTRGDLFLNRGRIGEVRRLGLEADLPGALDVRPAQVVFWQRTASSFDGLDLRVLTDREASLVVRLSSGPAPAETFSIRLADFATADSDHVFRTTLGNGHRLLVRRTRDDRLRVQLDKESLVLAPAATWSLSVQPHHLGVAAGTTARLTAELLDATGQPRWRSPAIDVTVDEQGSAATASPLAIPVPDDEGAYTLQLDLAQRRFANPLMSGKSLARRKLEFVVVQAQPGPILEPILVPDEPWPEIAELNLSDPDWWERWNWIPQIPLPAGMRSEPVGSGPLERIDRGADAYYRLPPNEWTAAPLPVAEVGRPHVLEVAYPNDHPQTFGITILEPNAAGEVTPLFLDSGVDVPAYPPPENAAAETHRLVFWPRTKNPWLLITNRRAGGDALFGSLRVRSGPESLPPAARGADGSSSQRLLAVYFDKPLFPQNFMAAEAIEPSTTPPRSLNGWKTFFDGGRRLVEYLQHVGYNAAMVSVMRDGSTLYPSRLLESTPRFDNGTFFVDGRDPIPKDVLEMLFRQFDSAGLTLIPAFHFASPLPEVERLLRASEQPPVGIELTNGRRESYLSSFGAHRGLAPYYNPLDQRVQAAIKNAIGEVVARYGHHRSFGGISLQLGDETYTQLPDEEWGQDAQTWARFRQAAVSSSAQPENLRQRWLDWRAGVLADFYGELAGLLARHPQAKLYLSTAGSLDSKLVQQEMRPRLLRSGRFAEAMLRQGLDASKLAESEHVVLLRPRRLAPIVSLAKQGADLAINRSPEVDRFYQAAANYGAMHFHEPLNLRLPEFDAATPFGAATTTWLSAHIPPAGGRNRARFTQSLARLDAQAIVEGGWMIPLGQEDSVRELLATYVRLPVGVFETVTPSSDSRQPPTVAVRKLTVGGQTYCYLVNDGPWSTEITLQLQTPAGTSVRSLDGRQVSQPEVAGGKLLWTVPLRSYDLRAVVFTSPQLAIVDWQSNFADHLRPVVENLFDEVVARIKQVQQNPPPLPVLTNPGFEQPSAAGRIPGWKAAEHPHVTIKVDPRREPGGGHALHLQVTNQRAIGWMRSDEFPLPDTGRICVSARIRTANPARQPALRIAIDLLTPGKPPEYFPTALGMDLNESTGEKVPAEVPLSADWQTFVYPFELPLDGPQQVAIGFDLFGEGEVWIDDVRVYDLYFEEAERDELLTTVAVEKYNVPLGKLSECHDYLDGFWPRFLLDFVPAPAPQRVATRPAAAPASSEPEESRSTWDRILPKIPLRLPFQ